MSRLQLNIRDSKLAAAATSTETESDYGALTDIMIPGTMRGESVMEFEGASIYNGQQPRAPSAGRGKVFKAIIAPTNLMGRGVSSGQFQNRHFTDTLQSSIDDVINLSKG